MKIAYLDDEEYFLDEMKQSLEDYLKHNPGSFTYSLFSSIDEFLFSYDNFDVFFLDIHLEDHTGIDIAKKIRSSLGQVDIVFVTSDPKHIFDGFQLGAKNYLLKPIQEDQLFYCLNTIRQQGEATLLIEIDGITKKISLDDITYIESDGHYLLIHTDEVYRYKEKMEKIKNNLSDKFIQTHRSYLVNLTKVEEIHREYLRIGDTNIPVARNRYKDVYQSFIAYHRSESL